jgi:sugar phosphate permease
MTAFAKEVVQMLDEILGIIADVIFGRLFKRWKNGRKWNVLSVFAAVAVVCLMIFWGYRAIGWYVFALLAIAAAVLLLAILWDKQKSKERK